MITDPNRLLPQRCESLNILVSNPTWDGKCEPGWWIKIDGIIAPVTRTTKFQDLNITSNDTKTDRTASP